LGKKSPDLSANIDYKAEDREAKINIPYIYNKINMQNKI